MPVLAGWGGVVTARDTHLADQVEAAAAEVDAMLYMVAAALGRRVHPRPTLTGPVRDALDAWRDTAEQRHGVLTGCDHLTTTAPRPVFGMLNSPGRVWCALCARDAVHTEADQHPDRCDTCGTGGHVRFRELTLTVGAVVLVAAVCTSCAQGVSA